MTNYNDKYQNFNFNIEEIPSFNNTDSYDELSMYLDFACHTTIKRQMPNIDPESESNYARQLITNYMMGDTDSFTRQFGIRQNVNKIGRDKIRGILISNMIEKEAFNLEQRKLLNATEYPDQCARYITQITASGYLNDGTNYAWITENIETLIDSYIKMKYERGEEARTKYQYYASKNPHTQKALEQLNLEMKIESLKK